MTRSERIAAIRHWRQCEMLEQPFFSIKCGSTAMDTTSFGELIDFLLDCTQTTGAAKAIRECYQIASSHEFGPDAAKTIREKFGLEI